MERKKKPVGPHCGGRWSEEEALAVLQAQEASGSSVHHFAQEHGLSPQRIYYWRQRLSAVVDEEQRSHREVIEFAPVVLADGRSRATVMVRVGEVELEVADPTAVDPRWVASVLLHLRGQ